MKIKPLGCYGGQLPGKNNTAFLVNGDTLIDAGTIALNSDIKTQRGIKTVFLSHAHLDHTGGLPFFAVNIVSNKSHGVNIIGPGPAVGAVKKHLMNGVTWPDFTKIKNFGGKPVFNYVSISAEKWHKFGKYRIKIIPVKHTIPTWGYIIGHGSKYIMYTGDTKETNRIWAEGKKLGKKLKAVFAETAFPNKLQFLADASGHLVPATLEKSLKKLGALRPKVYVYHIKPEYENAVKNELKKINGFKITAVKEKAVYTV